MQADFRRSEILKDLRSAGEPVSAGALSAKYGVSRQIIVGDVALLRASGEKISATPRGYVIGESGEGLVRQVACCHSGEQMEEELNAIVDQGCAVLDVIVEHPIYGQITGVLDLRSRYDVSRFILKCREADARPLSELTEGIHLHSVSCPNEEAFERVCRELGRLGVLLEK